VSGKLFENGRLGVSSAPALTGGCG
jgi:hypothetical protein